MRESRGAASTSVPRERILQVRSCRRVEDAVRRAAVQPAATLLSDAAGEFVRILPTLTSLVFSDRPGLDFHDVVPLLRGQAVKA